MRILRRSATVAVLAAGLGSVAAAQHSRLAIEARAGVNVPTSGIADVVESGLGVGAGLSFRLSGRLWLLADVDYGWHDRKPTTGRMNVTHYIAKLGYDLTAGSVGAWSVILNGGAGAVAVAFGDARETYPAINAGAKVAYRLHPQLAVLLSSQGDRAYSQEEDFGAPPAWIWLITAGLRLTL